MSPLQGETKREEDCSKWDRIADQPQSDDLGSLAADGPTVASNAPQAADAPPAIVRTQWPCGPESRRAAASNSAPVTTAQPAVSATNGRTAIAGQTRTVPARPRF